MTPQADRIASLDVLRGLGILGILAVNASVFAQPFALQFDPVVLGPMDPDSTNVWALVHVAFERKFVTLFSMLFGASILLVGGDGTDPERNRILYRRLGWLALFGLIHGAAVWYGDILLCYAVTGFVAVLFRRWTPRRLIVTGALMTTVMAGFEAVDAWNSALASADAAQAISFANPEAARVEISAFGGDFASSLIANFEHWQVMAGYTLYFVPATLGLMLMGMGLFRTGVLKAERSAGLYALLLAAGLASMALLGWAAWREVGSVFTDAPAGALRESINGVLSPVMTLGYVGLICLIVKSPLRWLTGPLAAAGQMAFTNYLTQSLIMTAIFYGGRGLGLFGSLTLAQVAPIVVGVWVLQLVWSPLWLMAFRYGPFEWVWRSLTFGRPVAFRRVAGEA